MREDEPDTYVNSSSSKMTSSISNPLSLATTLPPMFLDLLGGRPGALTKSAKEEREPFDLCCMAVEFEEADAVRLWLRPEEDVAVGRLRSGTG